MAQRQVAITTLGCKINQFESAAMIESLGREGFEVVPFEEQADVYVINTCTVTAKTDAESRRLIRRAQRQNPGAKIVVTGCYAQVAHDRLKDMPGVNLILGNSEKRDIAGLISQADGDPKVIVSDIAQERGTAGLVLESFAEHTRAFLQVQNGCDAFCSYCIVPHARGRSRSVPLAEALAGIRGFAAQGYREVVLTGIHLGGYGRDLTPPTSLLDLLGAVEEQRLVPRLRIGSVEPTEISPELIEFLAQSAIVCHHLHIPLQSGDDQVLERMNRHYTADFFRDLVARLVAAIPDLAIGLDVIAGFPGETDEEFRNCRELLESLPVASLHVFPFSSREGTPAALMEQVRGEVVKARAQELRRIGERKRQLFHERFVGRELPVLVQSRSAEGSLQGLSRNYIPVFLDGDDSLVNREVTLRITGRVRQGLRGELVPAGE